MKESKAEGKEAGVLALHTAHLLGGTAKKENHRTWELQGHMQERSLLQEAMGVTRNQTNSSCGGRSILDPFFETKSNKEIWPNNKACQVTARPET